MFLLIRKNHVNNILKKCRAITVTVEHLADYACKFNSNVHIITGPIDCDYYVPVRFDNKKEIIIGWMGSPTTTPFLADILPALEQVIKIIPNCQIKAVGASPFDTRGIPVVFEKWSLENERKQLASFDIGIMPLRNDEWCRGKGGLKILQYFAMQRPVVCSPVGINKELVIHGRNGFFAEDINKWVKYLVQLARDSALRDLMGQEGRRLVVNKFSLKGAVELFAEVLRG
jgi:glycosyltransferase involved in cell wall biosynthesis